MANNVKGLSLNVSADVSAAQNNVKNLKQTLYTLKADAAAAASELKFKGVGENFEYLQNRVDTVNKQLEVQRKLAAELKKQYDSLKASGNIELSNKTYKELQRVNAELLRTENHFNLLSKQRLEIVDTQQINKTTLALKTAQAQAETFKKSMHLEGVDTEQLGIDAIDRFKESVRLAQEQIELYREKINSGNLSAEEKFDYAQKINQLTDNILNYNKSIEEVATSLENLGNKNTIFDRLDSSVSNLKANLSNIKADENLFGKSPENTEKQIVNLNGQVTLLTKKLKEQEAALKSASGDAEYAKLNATLAQTKNAIAAANKEIKNLSANKDVETIDSKFKVLNSTLSKLKTQSILDNSELKDNTQYIETLTKKSELLASELAKTSVEYNNMGSGESKNNLQVKMNELEEELSSVNNELKNLDNASKNINFNEFIAQTTQGMSSIKRDLSVVNEKLKFDPTNTDLLAQKQKLLSQYTQLSTNAIVKLKAAEDTIGSDNVENLKNEIARLEIDALNTTGSLSKMSNATKDNTVSYTKMGLSVNLIGKAFNSIESNMDGAISRFDTLNKYPSVMKSLGYATDDVTKSQDRLQKGIDGLPTSMDQIVGMTQSLANATSDYNISADMAARVAVAFNNGMLANNATSQQAEAALTQLNQAFAKGKLQAEEYNSINEAGNGILNQLAKQLGYSSAEFRELASSGKISMATIMQGFIDASEAENGWSSRAQKNSNGLKTSIENLSTATVKAITTIITKFDEAIKKATGESLAEHIDNLKNKISSLADDSGPTIEKLTRTLVTLAPAIKTALAAFAGYTVISKVISVGNNAISMFNGLKTSILNIADSSPMAAKAVGSLQTALNNLASRGLAVNLAMGGLLATLLALAGLVIKVGVEVYENNKTYDGSREKAETKKIAKDKAKIIKDSNAAIKAEDDMLKSALAANEKSFMDASKAANGEYSKQIIDIEEDLAETLTSNKEDLAEEQLEIEKSYQEDLLKNKEDYNKTLQKAEESYQEDLTKNQEDYNKTLLKNEEKYQEDLLKNKEDYNKSLQKAEEDYRENLAKNQEDYNKSILDADKTYNKTLESNQTAYNKSKLKVQEDYEKALTKNIETEQKARLKADETYNKTLLKNKEVLEKELAKAEETLNKSNSKAAKTKDNSEVKALKDKEKAYVKAAESQENSIKKAQEQLTKTNETALKNREKSNKNAYKSLEDAQIKADKSYATALKRAEDTYNKAAERAQTNLKKAYANIDKTLEKSLTTIDSNLSKNIDEINKNAIKSIEDLRKDYDNQVKQLANSIYNQQGLFDEVNFGEADKVTLDLRLNTQIKQLDEFNEALKLLGAKGASTELIKELEGMGLASLAQIKALSTMTEIELENYQAKWQEKHNKAQAMAEQQMIDAGVELQAKIDQINADAQTQIQEAKSAADAEIKAAYAEQLLAYKEAQAEMQAALDESNASMIESQQEALSALNEARTEANTILQDSLAEAQIAYNESLAEAQQTFKDAQSEAQKALAIAHSEAETVYAQSLTDARDAYAAELAEAQTAYAESKAQYQNNFAEANAQAKTDRQEAYADAQNDLKTANLNAFNDRAAAYAEAKVQLDEANKQAKIDRTTAYAEAKTQLDEANKQSSIERQRAYAEAKTQLDEANKQAFNDRQKSNIDAKKQLDEANNQAFNDRQKAYNDAKKQLDEANRDAENARLKAYQTAQDNFNKANADAYNARQKAYDDANKQLRDALAQAQATRDAADAEAYNRKAANEQKILNDTNARIASKDEQHKQVNAWEANKGPALQRIAQMANKGQMDAIDEEIKVLKSQYGKSETAQADLNRLQDGVERSRKMSNLAGKEYVISMALGMDNTRGVFLQSIAKINELLMKHFIDPINNAFTSILNFAGDIEKQISGFFKGKSIGYTNQNDMYKPNSGISYDREKMKSFINSNVNNAIVNKSSSVDNSIANNASLTVNVSTNSPDAQNIADTIERTLIGKLNLFNA